MKYNDYLVDLPTKIITTNLNINSKYQQKCLEEIYKLGDAQNNKTNVKAIMSNYHIWKDTDILNPLIDEIVSVSNNIYPPYYNRFNYILIDCWSAIYQKEHHSIPHTHFPYGQMSFVYYLKTSSNSSPLVFDECNFEIQPQEDMLVLFPTYMFHSVPKQKINEDRVVVAGNLQWDLIVKDK